MYLSILMLMLVMMMAIKICLIAVTELSDRCTLPPQRLTVSRLAYSDWCIGLRKSYVPSLFNLVMNK